jgi:hypothetical protein
MGFIGKRPQPGPESIHIGHFAALGTKAALMPSQHGHRFASMTPQHIIWATKYGGLRIVGWGDVEKIQWPERAVEHVPDLRTFSRGFAPMATAGLRFGYVYQLGPIAEWLFFVASNPDREDSVPPPLWQTQWQPPSMELALGEDGLIVDLDRMLTAGTTDPVVAKRLQMARLLRGIVSNDRGEEFSSLEELARLFAREERPVRALAVGAAATCRSDPQDPTIDSLAELLKNVRGETTEATQGTIQQVVFNGTWSSLLELLWHLENIEIAAATG